MAATTTEPATASSRRRIDTALVIRLIVLAAVLTLAGWYFNRATSWSEFTAALSAVSVGQGTLVVLLAVVNLLTYWFVLMAALPRLRIGQAGQVYLASTALSNSLPAGGVVGTGYTVQRLRTWGFDPFAITSALVANGIFAMTAKLALAVVAVGALAISFDGDVWAVVVLLAVTALFLTITMALLLSRRVLVRVAGWIDAFRERRHRRRSGDELRGRWSDRVVRFQAETRELLSRRGWVLAVATVASNLALFALFMVCLRATGLRGDQISATELLVAFGLSRIVTVVSLTPGGIGLVEVSLSATLTIQGSPVPEAVAGVVLFRAASYAIPTLIGLLVFAVHVVSRRSRERAGSDDEASAPDPRATRDPASCAPVPDGVAARPR